MPSVSQGLGIELFQKKQVGKEAFLTSLLYEVLMCVRSPLCLQDSAFSHLPSPPQAPAWHAPSHHSGHLESSGFALQEVPESALGLLPLTGLCSSAFWNGTTPVICCQDWLGPAVPARPPCPLCVPEGVGVCLCAYAYTHVHVLCSTHFMESIKNM